MNHEPVTEQQRLAWERQLVVFGMCLASKEVRAQLKQDDFSCDEIGYAFSELIAGPQKAVPDGIRYLLAGLGVPDWEPKDGNLVRLLIEHVRLDARFRVMVLDIAEAFNRVEKAQSAGASEKIKALQYAEATVTTAYRIQQAAKQAAASRLTETSEGNA